MSASDSSLDVAGLKAMECPREATLKWPLVWLFTLRVREFLVTGKHLRRRCKDLSNLFLAFPRSKAPDKLTVF